jgi:hypothetical protein
MSVTRIMFVTLVTSITLVMLKNSLLNQRVKLAGVTFVASVALCNVCYAGRRGGNGRYHRCNQKQFACVLAR